ncbi:MAG: hypothetical protein AABX01_01715 [Candidatus Micrarchaeota archaeon]
MSDNDIVIHVFVGKNKLKKEEIAKRVLTAMLKSGLHFYNVIEKKDGKSDMTIDEAVKRLCSGERHGTFVVGKHVMLSTDYAVLFLFIYDHNGKYYNVHYSVPKSPLNARMQVLDNEDPKVAGPVLKEFYGRARLLLNTTKSIMDSLGDLAVFAVGDDVLYLKEANFEPLQNFLQTLETFGGDKKYWLEIYSNELLGKVKFVNSRKSEKLENGVFLLASPLPYTCQPKGINLGD